MKPKRLLFTSLSFTTMLGLGLGLTTEAQASGGGLAPEEVEQQQAPQQNQNAQTEMNAAILQQQQTGQQFGYTTNLTGERFTTVAHRGASGYAPEHTFNAYDKSHNEIGASYIEIDLQMTKDGHLIAMHDEEVDRTTNGKGRVEDYTLKKLKKLDAGSWFNEDTPEYASKDYEGAQIPTLDEILERYGTDANYYIETKSPDVYPGMEEKLIDVLDKHNMLTNDSLQNGHVLIQSFSPESLEKMHKLNPSLPLIRLMEEGEIEDLTAKDIEYLRQIVVGVGPEYSDLNAQNTQMFKQNGFLIHPYTVDEADEMREMNNLGVDGLFTNYADVYKGVVSEYE